MKDGKIMKTWKDWTLAALAILAVVLLILYIGAVNKKPADQSGGETQGTADSLTRLESEKNAAAAEAEENRKQLEQVTKERDDLRRLAGELEAVGKERDDLKLAMAKLEGEKAALEEQFGRMMPLIQGLAEAAGIDPGAETPEAETAPDETAGDAEGTEGVPEETAETVPETEEAAGPEGE